MSPHLLADIWFIIICIEAALYVVLDGANLGIGILSLFPQSNEKRDLIFRAFGPMWDANETWLLIAAATTYGAFPMVYSIGLNALYIPTMIMGVGLVVRVVSYEFYAQPERQILWRVLFGVGSLLAAIGQGLLFGGYISGITIVDGQFAGGALDWATPVTMLLTIGLLFAYMVLGYANLIRFVGYELSPRAFRTLLLAAGVTFAALVSATALIHKTNYLFFARWTTPPTSYALYVIAVGIVVLAMLLAYGAFRQVFVRYLHLICMLIFGLGFLGMVIGVYPYIMLPNVTIYEAASSPATQQFMLWGLGPILPIVLAYQFFIQRLFGTDREVTYHH